MTIEEQLLKIKKEKRIGIMTHVVVGYPSISKTISFARIMASHGADFIELQIPFSDPLADGPIIMHACEKSLENGTTVKDAFIVAKKLTTEIAIPILFMSYFNLIFVYGVERFCRDAKKVGVSGLIIPDMPPDEEKGEHFYFYCRKYGIHNIQVISPASTKTRLLKNASVASGFVYCIARQGITGAKETLDPHLFSYLKNVRRYIGLPLAVGFGISKKEYVDVLKHHADIAIVGSVIIDIINTAEQDNIEKEIGDFLDSLTYKNPEVRS